MVMVLLESVMARPVALSRIKYVFPGQGTWPSHESSGSSGGDMVNR